jgi:hypothetical protein
MNIPGQHNPNTYEIPYTYTQIKKLFTHIDGDVIDTEFDFEWDTVTIRKTNNFFLRLWSHTWAKVFKFSYNQYDRWGDYTMVIDEHYEDKRGKEFANLVSFKPIVGEYE